MELLNSNDNNENYFLIFIVTVYFNIEDKD